jgi:hypothetical protein
VTGVAAFTLLVVTGNVVELAPCATVTDVGTLAAPEFELESVTTAPPEGAAAVRVTVPVADWPPRIVPELTETLLSTAGTGLTVRANVMLTPVYEAVRVADVEIFTFPAATVKDAEVEP